ncbi:MAG: hypothetical protein QF893_09370 [Alphaproteobacteria bacterium]|nr:hypothetical protein [Alphaproteobacteria bacterium]
MLFLILSQPLPTRPSEVAGNRQRYWDWVQPLIDGGEVTSVYGRVGRGAVATMDVASNERLHALLNEWGDIIPAEFQVHPLVDPAAAREFLATQT